MKAKQSKSHKRRSCDGKVRYPSPQAASHAVYRYQEKVHASFRAYHCCYCNAWHIGHVYYH